jgi:hypothetical protein
MDGQAPPASGIEAFWDLERLLQGAAEIYMYRPDPPHFHAEYGEHIAQIELGSLEILNGSLPPRALRLVREWARLHPDELAENWALAQALEPLVPIDPLA